MRDSHGFAMASGTVTLETCRDIRQKLPPSTPRHTVTDVQEIFARRPKHTRFNLGAPQLCRLQYFVNDLSHI